MTHSSSSSKTTVSPERIRRALLLVAELCQKEPKYLPIFERLEREVAALEGRATAADRARALCEQN